MKSRSLVIVFLIIVFGAAHAEAQSKQKQPKSNSAAANKAPNTQPDRNREMENATPAAAHAVLGKLAGEYTTITKFDMQSGAAPQETTGEARLWVTLDGRF